LLSTTASITDKSKISLLTSGSAQSLFTFKTGDVYFKVTSQDELVVGKVSSQIMALVRKPWQNFIFDPRANFSRKAVHGEDLGKEAVVRNLKESLSRTSLYNERSRMNAAILAMLPLAKLISRMMTARRY